MMLEIRNVRKAFGSLEVLKGVDLRVEQGDVAAILGPSGSGKTTLLRCINFLETAGGGTMTFDGEDFRLDRTPKKDIARLRKKTAFVFQDYNLFRNKTALQNVAEGLITARKAPKAQAEKIGLQALEKVGLADQIHKRPNQLSGGQMQRVAIARALVNDPDILLADEPTGNLDGENSRNVVELLTRLAHEEGYCVIIVTHDLAIAQSSDVVFHMEDGVLRQAG